MKAVIMHTSVKHTFVIGNDEANERVPLSLTFYMGISLDWMPVGILDCITKQEEKSNLGRCWYKIAAGATWKGI